MLVGKVNGHGATYVLLDGIGMIDGSLQAVVCGDCGYTRLFAPRIPLAAIKKSKSWKRADTRPAEETDDSAER